MAPPVRQRQHPGLAKVRAPHPYAPRTVRLVRVQNAHWGPGINAADIVSEGSEEIERQRIVYRGTTSLRLRLCAAGPPPVTVLLDPHLRVQAVRVARREAQVRASAALDTVFTDTEVALTHDGVCITVELEATVQRPARQVSNA